MEDQNEEKDELQLLKRIVSLIPYDKKFVKIIFS